MDRAYADLLVGAGFAAPRVRTLAYARRFASADGPWTDLPAASVRAVALITGQTAGVQWRIRARFDEQEAEYATPGGLEVPVSGKLFSATAPA